MQVKERGAKTKYLSWEWGGKGREAGKGRRAGSVGYVYPYIHAMPYIIFSFFSFWAEGKARGDPAVGLFVRSTKIEIEKKEKKARPDFRTRADTDTQTQTHGRPSQGRGELERWGGEVSDGKKRPGKRGKKHKENDC